MICYQFFNPMTGNHHRPCSGADGSGYRTCGGCGECGRTEGVARVNREETGSSVKNLQRFCSYHAGRDRSAALFGKWKTDRGGGAGVYGEAALIVRVAATRQVISTVISLPNGTGCNIPPYNDIIFTRYEPPGVIACLLPFNFPVELVRTQDRTRLPRRKLPDHQTAFGPSAGTLLRWSSVCA